jgi:hypothetical protein
LRSDVLMVELCEMLAVLSLTVPKLHVAADDVDHVPSPGSETENESLSLPGPHP